MADNVTTGTTGLTVGADEVVDGTLGTIKVQYVKIMDGTLDGTTKALVDGDGLAVKQAKSGTATDKSITSATTSTLTIASNSSRRGYLIENPFSATLNSSGLSIFVNVGAAATATGDSFEVTPGGYFPPPGVYARFTGDIHVTSTSSGIKVIAKEFT